MPQNGNSFRFVVLSYGMENAQQIIRLQNPVGNLQGLRIRMIGLYERMSPDIVNRPFGTHDYLMMHFHDAVQIDVDGEFSFYPANAFVVWEPGTVHRYGNKDLAWSHSWIHCDGEVVSRSLIAAHIPLNRPIQLAGAEISLRYLADLYEEIYRHPSPDTFILESYLKLWVRELQRELSPAQRLLVPDNLLAARRFIDNGFSGKITLVDLARIAHLSPSHFSTEFHRHFGASPIEYLLALRMQQAGYFLEDFNLTVYQVGARVGIDDPSYFSKQFKKHHGVSPAGYRKGLLDRR
jgi:AraC family transcriptional regulator of arabinose operon